MTDKSKYIDRDIGTKREIRTKGLARHLSEYSEGLYHIYECEDILNMLIELVPMLVLDGKEVSLTKLVTFRQKHNKERKSILPKTPDVSVVFEASTTIHATVSDRLNKEFKKAYRYRKNPKNPKALDPYGHYRLVRRSKQAKKVVK